MAGPKDWWIHHHEVAAIAGCLSPSLFPVSFFFLGAKDQHSVASKRWILSSLGPKKKKKEKCANREATVNDCSRISHRMLGDKGRCDHRHFVRHSFYGIVSTWQRRVGREQRQRQSLTVNEVPARCSPTLSLLRLLTVHLSFIFSLIVPDSHIKE